MFTWLMKVVFCSYEGPKLPIITKIVGYERW